MRLQTDCVPGRAGCVLGSGTVFAVPAEQRVREREEEKRRAAGLPPSNGGKRLEEVLGEGPGADA